MVADAEDALRGDKETCETYLEEVLLSGIGGKEEHAREFVVYSEGKKKYEKRKYK